MESAGKFVIQEHSRLGEVHWDLMFEAGPVLETYRLEVPPEQLCSRKSAAVKIFDHPMKFLTYQGTVNRGTGTVRIADEGHYRLLARKENSYRLKLTGRIVSGEFVLTFIESDRWELSPSQ